MIRIFKGRCERGLNFSEIFYYQVITETSNSAKLELYRLIGEGYKAMQEGRTSTIEEVREKLEKRRKERGQGGIY